MMASKWVRVSAFVALIASQSVFANDHLIRWTAADDVDGSVDHVIDVLSKKIRRPLTAQDFVIQEDRDLAFNHYKRLVQLADGVAIHGKSIRIWTELGSTQTVQVEA